jgi:hypothetical protein
MQVCVRPSDELCTKNDNKTRGVHNELSKENWAILKSAIGQIRNSFCFKYLTTENPSFSRLYQGPLSKPDVYEISKTNCLDVA